MFTLRCTSRLMKRLGPSLAASPAEATTRLGDWYANLVHVGRRQFVLCVSEQTLQPVVIPAAPIATLVPRLRVGVAQVLAAFGIADEDIANENAAMEDVDYGKTPSCGSTHADQREGVATRACTTRLASASDACGTAAVQAPSFCA